MKRCATRPYSAHDSETWPPANSAQCNWERQLWWSLRNLHKLLSVTHTELENSRPNISMGSTLHMTYWIGWLSKVSPFQKNSEHLYTKIQYIKFTTTYTRLTSFWIIFVKMVPITIFIGITYLHSSDTCDVPSYSARYFHAHYISKPLTVTYV